MNKGWRFYKADETHPWADVVPVDDDHPLPHYTQSFDDSCACHCLPVVEFKDKDGTPLNYPLVIHSAHDGRELIEQADAILCG